MDKMFLQQHSNFFGCSDRNVLKKHVSMFKIKFSKLYKIEKPNEAIFSRDQHDSENVRPQKKFQFDSLDKLYQTETEKLLFPTVAYKSPLPQRKKKEIISSRIFVDAYVKIKN